VRPSVFNGLLGGASANQHGSEGIVSQLATRAVGRSAGTVALRISGSAALSESPKS
jgi:hypothetical protein